MPALVLAVLPTPSGLSVEGHRVITVVVLAIRLWGSDLLPAGVTAVLVMR